MSRSIESDSVGEARGSCSCGFHFAKIRRQKKNNKKTGSKITEFGRLKWARARDGDVEGRDANQAQIKEEERDYKEVTPA